VDENEDMLANTQIIEQTGERDDDEPRQNIQIDDMEINNASPE